MFKLSHLRPALALTLALTVFVAHAQNNNNKKAAPAPPPKPAPAARPAPAPQQRSSAPAGNSNTSRPANGATNTSHGPTIAGANNNASHGPTIANTNSNASHSPTIAGANNHTQPTTGATTSHAPTTGSTTRPAPSPTGRPLPTNAKPVTTRSGNTVVTRANGHPSDIHDVHRGIDVHHGLDGSRRVSVTRADHSRIVAMRGRPGFVERPYAFHGHDFARRTYYFHGRAYDRFYRGYDFRGAHFAVYAPGLYYRPAFYGWAYAGWAHPIAYGWGWGPSPWVGYYGGYFSPYAVYPGPAFWLTDYMISTDLAEQYQAQADANALPPPPPSGAPMLSEQDKQMIAAEVRNEIALENTEAQQTAAGQDVDPASSSIARIISDNKPHVFIVGGPLDLVDTAGNECAVSEGDVLMLASDPPADSPVAQLNVLASKGGNECAKSANVNVALADLQDMQNHMRERIDQGLADLQAKQGQGGLPTLPPSANAPGAPAPFVADAPPPDANGAAEVTQQLAAADQSEQQVLAEAGQPAAHGPSPDIAPAPAPSGPPPTIAIGQSIDEVTAAFGQPVTIIDLGAKKIYQYKDMKVTFKAGKVADIQ